MVEVATRLKMGFIIVGCMYTCVYIYGLYYDQFMSCLDPQARWFASKADVVNSVYEKPLVELADLVRFSEWVQLAMVDVYINLLAIGAWIFYKEDFSLVKKPIAAFVIFITGSIAICAYVVRQLSKLSPEDSSKDPLYFVLARRQKANDTKHRSYSPATLRAFFGALISFMLGYYIYTYIVDGSPFRKVLTMCMVGTLADLFVIKGVISVWVAYKESSWISAFMWMLILEFFGSIGTCAYLVVQLSYLSPHQHVSSVLFKNNNNSDVHESDTLLASGKKLM